MAVVISLGFYVNPNPSPHKKPFFHPSRQEVITIKNENVKWKTTKNVILHEWMLEYIAFAASTKPSIIKQPMN